MKKYLLSIIIFTAFIGFVAYATVETMPTGIEQPIAEDTTVTPEVKVPANETTVRKTNFVKKKVVEPLVKDPVVEPTPITDPIIITTPPVIIYKQLPPVTNTTTSSSKERDESREDDD